MSKTFQNLTDLGGLRTDLPADKIPLRNASDCSEMDFSFKGQAQTRKGKRIFTSENTDVGTHLRGYLFKKSAGTLLKVLLRVRDDGTNSYLEWLNTSYTTDSLDGQWETLVSGLTTGAVMGFTPFNTSALDAGTGQVKVTNQLVFCNGEDNFSVWNGATATVSSVTANTIVCNETLETGEGFEASGTVIVNGTTYTYTGTSTKTFTGVTPNPSTGGVVANEGVAQSPDITTHALLPKGNILITSAARIWLASKDTLFYSEVGVSTNFSAGTSPEDPGIENFPDSGGNITLLESKDNNNIIIHKEDGILQFRLDYTATAKIPYLSVLTLADGSGATNQKASAGLNQISFITTRREGLKTIQRALDGDNLNLDNFSDQILPTIESYDFSEASAVYYSKKRCVYVACKSSSDENYNNKVIAFFLGRAANQNFLIDISINDDFVADWISDGDNLYALSSIDMNVFKYFDQYSNEGVGINHVWASKELTFDEPARLKNFNKVYVEGFIREGTKIKISVLYGLLGTSGEKSKVLDWDGKYVTSQKISVLGTDVIGTTSLGASSSEIQESYAFSVPIHFDNRWDTRYKIRIATEYDSETNQESYWAVTNIATNPNIQGIEQSQITNSNI